MLPSAQTNQAINFKTTNHSSFKQNLQQTTGGLKNQLSDCGRVTANFICASGGGSIHLLNLLIKALIDKPYVVRIAILNDKSLCIKNIFIQNEARGKRKCNGFYNSAFQCARAHIHLIKIREKSTRLQNAQ